MSYTSRESSIAAGQPVRLYLFERGALRWGYCSADRDLTLQAREYKATAISDDGLRQTGETSADLLRITLPGTQEVPQLFRGAPPSAEVWLTIREWHWGEADIAANVPVVWIGTVSAVNWPAADRAEISCETLSASMDRVGLRLTYMRSCPHALYDRHCRVDRNRHKLAATINAITGNTIGYSSPAMLPEGRAAGGYLEWAIGSGELERRSILGHSGSTLTLLGGASGLSNGQGITIYPGCRQTVEDCQTTFSNLDNYGGFNAMPGVSPFDGNPAF
ncbi:MAG: phage BR0599 family protein [Burkholderiaceae bacterium]